MAVRRRYRSGILASRAGVIYRAILPTASKRRIGMGLFGPPIVRRTVVSVRSGCRPAKGRGGLRSGPGSTSTLIREFLIGSELSSATDHGQMRVNVRTGRAEASERFSQARF